MNQTELMIAAGGGLFAAFLLGWIAGWLTLRAGGPAPAARPAPPAAPPPMALGTEDRLAAAEQDATRARDALREAQVEIEELRAYIDRKSGKAKDDAPAP